MAVRYTVSPHEGTYGVFDNGTFLREFPTWGQAKKEANRLNDGERTVRMKYEPQLAKQPGNSVVLGPQWVVERKWDGMRAIFEVHQDETFIFSRTGQDLRPQFPDLCQLHELLPHCILDGEILAMESEDLENLELLQHRIQDKKARRAKEIPVTVKFFDILELKGEDLRGQPLYSRRATLEDTVGQAFTTQIIPWDADVPAHWEGTVAKLLDSKYQSGKRPMTWVKIKHVHRATLWADGLTPGLGARKNAFGAIKVKDENGVARGQVGSGFTPAAINQIMELDANGTPYLVEVEYRFLSGKSGLMVNTAFKGIRTDKNEADVL